MEIERVQVVANNVNLQKLPEKFIRPFHERPENTKAIEGVTVPVISLMQPHDVVVNEISKACSEWGFFLLTDHGINYTLIEKLQEVGKGFFELPQEEKEVYANDPLNGKFMGYGTNLAKNQDKKLEWIDYFMHIISPPSKINYDDWPNDPPSYRDVTEEYNKEMVRVADEIFRIMSKGLGLEEEALKTALGGEEMEFEMKINMYPPCPQPELAIGVEAHTDMSALTILVPNDVPGLQVWKDGNWVAAQYVQNALFVHVGDQIEVLSNGKYKSVLHRSVVNKERMRMSWAVFIVPPAEKVIGPISDLVNDQNLAKYSTKTFAAFRYNKVHKLPQ